MTDLSILFVCVGNSCRSPMAEAMARHRGAGRVRAMSAGLAPTGRIAPETIGTLRRLGYPSSGLASKDLSAIDLRQLDIVVSLIGPAGLAGIPVSLPVERIAWRVRDPYREEEAVYLAIAREIEDRVGKLVEGALNRELPLL